MKNVGHKWLQLKSYRFRYRSNLEDSVLNVVGGMIFKEEFTDCNVNALYVLHSVIKYQG